MTDKTDKLDKTKIMNISHLQQGYEGLAEKFLGWPWMADNMLHL